MVSQGGLYQRVINLSCFKKRSVNTTFVVLAYHKNKIVLSSNMITFERPYIAQVKLFCKARLLNLRYIFLNFECICLFL